MYCCPLAYLLNCTLSYSQALPDLFCPKTLDNIAIYHTLSILYSNFCEQEFIAVHAKICIFLQQFHIKKQRTETENLFLPLKITPSQSFSTVQCCRKSLLDYPAHFLVSEWFLSAVLWCFKGSVSSEFEMMRHFSPETSLNTQRFPCKDNNLYSHLINSLS